jgi:hypothetical protein
MSEGRFIVRLESKVSFWLGVVIITLVALLMNKPAECSDWDGLHVHKLQVDRKANTGRAIVTWNGVYPLSHYENRWLLYSISTANADISFHGWIKQWYGTCKEPPCRMHIEFVTKNVNVVTK